MFGRNSVLGPFGAARGEELPVASEPVQTVVSRSSSELGVPVTRSEIPDERTVQVIEPAPPLATTRATVPVLSSLLVASAPSPAPIVVRAPEPVTTRVESIQPSEPVAPFRTGSVTTESGTASRYQTEPVRAQVEPAPESTMSVSKSTMTVTTKTTTVPDERTPVAIPTVPVPMPRLPSASPVPVVSRPVPSSVKTVGAPSPLSWQKAMPQGVDTGMLIEGQRTLDSDTIQCAAVGGRFNASTNLCELGPAPTDNKKLLMYAGGAVAVGALIYFMTRK